MRKNELIGKVFGRLTVIADGGRTPKKNILWLCRCVCGKTTRAAAYDLSAGKVVSCGCYAKERHPRTHGMAHTPTYNVWAAMVQRCTNKKDRGWNNYGGRGICVDSRWLRFETFYEDMGTKPEGCSLERENVNGGYCATNCKWIPVREQARNTRRNVHILWRGELKLQIDWCTKLGTTSSHIAYYVKKGLTRGDALERIFSKNTR